MPYKRNPASLFLLDANLLFHLDFKSFAFINFVYFFFPSRSVDRFRDPFDLCRLFPSSSQLQLLLPFLSFPSISFAMWPSSFSTIGKLPPFLPGAHR